MSYRPFIFLASVSITSLTEVASKLTGIFLVVFSWGISTVMIVALPGGMGALSAAEYEGLYI